MVARDAFGARRMSSVVILDTSVYLNILDVPGFNQDREQILEEFADRMESGDYFLLPLAAIWETGNHIAHLPAGGERYRFGCKLMNDVGKAVNGDAPYQPTYFPDREEFLAWLADFPSYVQRSKSVQKTREGTSLADLSMIKEWERTRVRHSMSRVLIWSLDTDLSSYDTASKT